MAKKYLTLEEAAERLGISADRLEELREEGQIKGFADRGTWKFDAGDVEEFARSEETDSSPEIELVPADSIVAEELDFDDSFFDDDDEEVEVAADEQADTDEEVSLAFEDDDDEVEVVGDRRIGTRLRVLRNETRSSLQNRQLNFCNGRRIPQTCRLEPFVAYRAQVSQQVTVQHQRTALASGQQRLADRTDLE